METNEAAQQAVNELNEKPFMERNIRVSLALERQERPSGGNREFRDRGDRDGGNRGGGNGGGYRQRQNTY